MEVPVGPAGRLYYSLSVTHGAATWVGARVVGLGRADALGDVCRRMLPMAKMHGRQLEEVKVRQAGRRHRGRGGGRSRHMS